MAVPKLKISVWNANGLVNHGQEVKTFLTMHDLDIMLISESHMTEKSYIKIPQYSLHHTQHPEGKARGGTTIIIKNNIKHQVKSKISEKNMQATTVEIEDSHGKMILSAVYCPPNLSIKKTQFENYFNTLGHRFISGGDFNAKHTHWGSRLITPRGRQLYYAMQSTNLQHLSTGQPTYWPTDRNKIPDVLDICITKGISPNYLKVDTCLDLSSDHTPIMVSIESKVQIKTKPPRLTNKNTNWNEFRTILINLQNIDIPLKTAQDIDEAVEHLTKSIQQAAWRATNEMQEEIKPGFVPKNIKAKLIEKRKLRKRWQITRDPIDRTNLNRAIKNLKETLADHKNQGVRTFLENLSASKSTEYSLWKVARKIKQSQKTDPPVRRRDGDWTRSEQEKADAFAEHLGSVFKPFPQEVPNATEQPIHQLLNAPYQMELPIKQLKIKQIKNVLAHNVHPRKAPGYDLITGEILKNLPMVSIRLITMIFNAILRLGYFPMQWKVAQVILIQKPGKDPSEVSSYRPISLLPILSKVYEKLLLEKLKPLLRKIIPNHQFGFRQHHATVEQVHRVARKIKNDLECKRYCSAAFLDISQAFDRVWHQGLIYKIKLTLPHEYGRILESYLSQRHFLVRHGEAYSTLVPIEAGVPQGSILGPLLYLIYTHDLPTTKDTEIATFADDTAIMASHQNPEMASHLLQIHLNKIEEWLKLWRIKANNSKSVHITFTLKRKTCPIVTLHGSPLPQKEEVKYLGIHLDNKLTWAKHIWYKRLQLGLTYRKMLWLLGRHSQLKLENKLLLYKAILKPIWTYGIQLWGSAADSNIIKIQRFQSKVLRGICDAPWYVTNHSIHQDLNTKTVKEEISSMSTKYQLRLGDHPNTLATDLLVAPRVKRLKRIDPLDLPQRT